ncbi:MAG: sigma-70 family polymerase sigma factor [Paenibacillus sp.]|jgi:RNA polymerase sigma-70 factor (ECF subfamily)|nr:sigma-70 family polymerase sigma factor [Paenibacillus sp.]
MHNRTDGELMQFVRNKQRPALEELYKRYVKLVFSFAMKSTGEEQAAREIVQLVFTRIWTSDTGFDAGKGRFVNWIITITRNITIDHIRKQRRQELSFPMEPQEWDPALSSIENDPESEFFRKWIKNEIQQAYVHLSESQVELINMMYWKGHSLREIAVITNEPVGTVKSRLHQCLKILRKHLTALREG